MFVLFILSSNVASCHAHTFVRGIVPSDTSVKSVASLLPAYPSATYVPSVLAPWFIKTSTPLTHHEWSSLMRSDVPRAPHVGRSGSMPSVMTEKAAASAASDLQVGKSAANIQSSQVSIQSSPVGIQSSPVSVQGSQSRIHSVPNIQSSRVSIQSSYVNSGFPSLGREQTVRFRRVGHASVRGGAGWARPSMP